MSVVKLVMPRCCHADRRFRVRVASVIVALASSLIAVDRASAGSPWLDPGDAGVRHDIQLLVDEGLLDVPVTVWPMSWPQVLRELENVRDTGQASAGALAALARVERRARSAASSGGSLTWRVAASGRPTDLRTFESVPREEGEIEGTADWLGDRFAVRLSATAVADPSDGKSVRPDGSYIGMTLGNWMLSAGYLERWWGPGWEGSNILGNNARPFLALGFDRKHTEPFETRWLSWLGPWSVNAYYGRLEGHREDVDHPHFLGLRVTTKPFDAVEIGLMRTAQWCGDDRNCDWDTFENLVTGNDNPGENVDPDEEPGNQMAGWDLRWASPFDSGPWALYYHDIGEDESNRKPIFRLKQAGIEAWGEVNSGTSWRAHIEWADTNPDCAPGSTGCAYRGGPYQVEGYSYYQRSLGHSMFYGGEMFSLGVTVAMADGSRIDALLRRAELNQRAPGQFHTVVDQPEERWNLELSYRRQLGSVVLAIGVGADQSSRDDGSDYVAGRGFVELRNAY
jgi:Capsule assembly protein Wzi